MRSRQNGNLTAEWRYHDIPSSGSGSIETNYLKTSYVYDDLGRVAEVKVKNPEENASWNFFGVTNPATGVYYHETRKYPASSTSGPISVTWSDSEGQVVRTFLAKATTAYTNPPDGSEALEALTRISHSYDWRHRREWTRVYHDLPSSGRRNRNDSLRRNDV